MLNTSPVATPEEIRFAYRLLLDREPDPAGLAHYTAMAATHRLTLAQLRDIFLISEEYRGRVRGRVVQVDIGGCVVVVDPADPIFGATIARHRMWEPHLRAILMRHLAPGSVYVDIGANLGTMAFPAAVRVGPGGKVIAFEPDPTNIAQFLQGVAANGFGHVTLFPVALSDARAVFALQGGSNAYLVAPGGSDLMAQAMMGDDLLGAEPRIDVIKLDIEGHEPFALRGLARTLACHRPLVLCEFNPRCLHDHIGLPPAAFAAEIFALTRAVTAIEHDGRENAVASAADLLALWAARNAQAVATGHLPDGMLHVDLLFRPG